MGTATVSGWDGPETTCCLVADDGAAAASLLAAGAAGAGFDAEAATTVKQSAPDRSARGSPAEDWPMTTP